MPPDAPPTLKIDLPDLSTLPRRVDRKTAAELVRHHFFPVSHRTLEAWPLSTRRVNGRALVETTELFAVAMEKLNEAPSIRAGIKAAPRLPSAR